MLKATGMDKRGTCYSPSRKRQKCKLDA